MQPLPAQRSSAVAATPPLSSSPTATAVLPPPFSASTHASPIDIRPSSVNKHSPAIQHLPLGFMHRKPAVSAVGNITSKLDSTIGASILPSTATTTATTTTATAAHPHLQQLHTVVYSDHLNLNPISSLNDSVTGWSPLSSATPSHTRSHTHLPPRSQSLPSSLNNSLRLNSSSSQHSTPHEFLSPANHSSLMLAFNSPSVNSSSSSSASSGSNSSNISMHSQLNTSALPMQSFSAAVSASPSPFVSPDAVRAAVFPSSPVSPIVFDPLTTTATSADAATSTQTTPSSTVLQAVPPLPDFSAFDRDNSIEKKRRPKREQHGTYPPRRIGAAAATAGAAVANGRRPSGSTDGVPAFLSSSHPRFICPDTPMKSPSVSKYFSSQQNHSQQDMSQQQQHAFTAGATPVFLSASARLSSARHATLRAAAFPAAQADDAMRTQDDNKTLNFSDAAAAAPSTDAATTAKFHVPAMLSKSLPRHFRPMTTTDAATTPVAQSIAATPVANKTRAFMRPSLGNTPVRTAAHSRANSNGGSGHATPVSSGKRKALVSSSGELWDALLPHEMEQRRALEAAAAAAADGAAAADADGFNDSVALSPDHTPHSHRSVASSPYPINHRMHAHGQEGAIDGTMHFPLVAAPVSQHNAAAAQSDASQQQDQLSSSVTAHSSDSTMSTSSVAATLASLERPNHFSQHFYNHGEIGRGSFGVVYHVLSFDDSREYAVKKQLRAFRGMKDRQHRLKEVENWRLLMQKQSTATTTDSTATTNSSSSIVQLIPSSDPLDSALDSRHIISFHNAWEEQGLLYIQSDLFTSGNLHTYLYDTIDAPVSENMMWLLLLDLARGVRFMHRCGILHLDLKWENCYVATEDSLRARLCRQDLSEQERQQQTGIVLIGDFGSSMRVDECANRARPHRHRHSLSAAGLDASSDSGAPEVEEGDQTYLAPEFLDPSLLGEDGTITAAADIFSLGMMMFEVAFDVVLPKRGQAWIDLRHERIDWTGAAYADTDSNTDAAAAAINASPSRGFSALRVSPLTIEPDFVVSSSSNSRSDDRSVCPPTAKKTRLSSSIAEHPIRSFTLTTNDDCTMSDIAAAPTSSPQLQPRFDAAMSPTSPLETNSMWRKRKSSVPHAGHSLPPRPSPTFMPAASSPSVAAPPANATADAGPYCGPALLPLIRRMLRRDPRARPSIEEVLSEPAFRDFAAGRRGAEEREELRKLPCVLPTRVPQVHAVRNDPMQSPVFDALSGSGSVAALMRQAEPVSLVLGEAAAITQIQQQQQQQHEQRAHSHTHHMPLALDFADIADSGPVTASTGRNSISRPSSLNSSLFDSSLYSSSRSGGVSSNSGSEAPSSKRPSFSSLRTSPFDDDLSLDVTRASAEHERRRLAKAQAQAQAGASASAASASSSLLVDDLSDDEDIESERSYQRAKKEFAAAQEQELKHSESRRKGVTTQRMQREEGDEEESDVPARNLFAAFQDADE